MKPLPKAQTVLDFWFGAPGSPEHGKPRECWFRKDLDFDAAIRARFGSVVNEALAGGLVDWAGDPRTALALLLLLDQFPRNLFRQSAEAFAGDPRARLLAREMVAARWDEGLLPVERVFVYLPFEHSEDLADQDRAVALFAALAKAQPGFAGFLDFAERHREVIGRFGRFPHRNAALGRASTPAEALYLAQPGSGF